MIVTSKQISQWGSYSDRKDSFDDTSDLIVFAQMCIDNPNLNKFIKSRVLNTHSGHKIKSKPFGDMGVDLGIYDGSGLLVATLDVERWSAWDQEWPSYYKWIHFLGRKDKFLNQYAVPFFMAYLNYSKNKVIVLDQGTLSKYETRSKYFQGKGMWDDVKEIPISEGNLFGKGFTMREMSLFGIA